jgi:hypothetical protein
METEQCRALDSPGIKLAERSGCRTNHAMK